MVVQPSLTEFTTKRPVSGSLRRGNCYLHFCIVSPGRPGDAAMARRNRGSADRVTTIAESNMNKVMQKLQRVGAWRFPITVYFA